MWVTMRKICTICSRYRNIFKHLKSEINFETLDLLEMLENLVQARTYYGFSRGKNKGNNPGNRSIIF